jgi:diaminohydroxyphosphoribosylaminopyrimidine deaminase / 5-amino-6-(5-phosphoribosylamino)uracil reductase
MNDLINELLNQANQPITVLGNPRVAALIVDDAGKIISAGVHRGKGTPHAEIDALNKATGDLSAYQMFVSLEPCNHHGATPPCSEAIISSGIKKITVGSLDINPISRGGIKRLIEAAIEVNVIGSQDLFRQLNFRWFESIKLERPFISAKIAMTLDGYIAVKNTQRLQITKDEAQRDVSALRSDFDAIMVGTNTVEADNPLLTIRDSKLIKQQSPLRVIMGNRDLSDDLNIFNDEAETIQIRTHDPEQVVNKLKAMGVTKLLIEGGSKIFTAFLSSNLIDELIVYVSSNIIGSGVGPLDENISIESIRQPYIKSAVALGPDVKVQMLLPRGI